MKAWVIKIKNGKYMDNLDECLQPLNMATLWPTKKSALDEGLPMVKGLFLVDDSSEAKVVKVEIKEIK